MRADKFFADRFGSRTKAKEALAAGRILRAGKQLTPADEVSEADAFTVLQDDDFVSNGGRKLERALNVFSFPVAGKIFADLGASTGGFSDCLLRHGARHIFCVDVGDSLLDSRIASDERVTVMDKTNARYLKRTDFPLPLDGVVSDLSFISLRLVLPAVLDILPAQGEALVLLKPQFECGKNALGKSGILPVARHRNLLADFYDFCTSAGLAPRGVVNAPILPKKNVEYVVRLQKEGIPIAKTRFLDCAENFRNA